LKNRINKKTGVNDTIVIWHI